MDWFKSNDVNPKRMSIIHTLKIFSRTDDNAVRKDQLKLPWLSANFRNIAKSTDFLTSFESTRYQQYQWTRGLDPWRSAMILQKFRNWMTASDFLILCDLSIETNSKCSLMPAFFTNLEWITGAVDGASFCSNCCLLHC